MPHRYKHYPAHVRSCMARNPSYFSCSNFCHSDVGSGEILTMIPGQTVPDHLGLAEDIPQVHPAGEHCWIASSDNSWYRRKAGAWLAYGAWPPRPDVALMSEYHVNKRNTNLMAFNNTVHASSVKRWHIAKGTNSFHSFARVCILGVDLGDNSCASEVKLNLWNHMSWAQPKCVVWTSK